MKRLCAAVALLMMSGVPMASAQPVDSPIEAQGPVGTLRGTLLAADAHDAPVVLIIPGSGPTDRDGNNSLGVAGAPYRLLAQALAEHGISTVRIDKRGIGGSVTPGLDPNAVTIADYAADTQAWTSAIKQRTGARCVWLAGHSEGALIAEAAAQSNRDLCGLILISGGGRNLADVINAQIHGNPANAPIVDASDHIVAELRAGRHVDASAIPPPLMTLYRPQVQGFLISMFSYDPPALLRSYPGPVLVIQGTSDIQVSMADAEALAGARPGVELARLDGVNHILKLAPADDRAANIATYTNASLPLAPGVAERIVAFITAHRGR